MANILEISVTKKGENYIVRVPGKRAKRSGDFSGCFDYVKRVVDDSSSIEFVLQGSFDSYQGKALGEFKKMHNVNYYEKELLLLIDQEMMETTNSIKGILRELDQGLIAQVMAFDDKFKRPKG